MEQIWQVVSTIIVMLFVIFAAYFLTRLMAIKMGRAGGKTHYIKIIDRFSISKDKSFVLISMGTRAYLIGVASQGMTMIDQFELSELTPEENQISKQPGTFPDIMTYLKKFKVKKTSNQEFNDSVRPFSDFMDDAENMGDKQNK